MATRTVVLDRGSGPDQRDTGSAIYVSRVIRGTAGDTLVYPTPQRVPVTNPPSGIELEVGQAYTFDTRVVGEEPITAIISGGAGVLLLKDLVPVDPSTLEPEADPGPAWFEALQELNAVTEAIAMDVAVREANQALDERDIPGQIADEVAASPTVVNAAAAAVTADIAGRDLVEGDDPRIPLKITKPDWVYLYLNKAKQIMGGITADGRMRFPRGYAFGDRQTMKHLPGEKYSRLSVSANGRIGEDALLADGTVPQQILDRWKTRMGFGSSTTVYKTVRPSPAAGEYASPKLANDSITDASASKQYVIVVFPGTYTETEWIVKDYVTIRGTVADRCVLAGELPDSATDAQITNTSTLWLKGTAALENLSVTARNMRYAVHSESSGASKDYVHQIKNCRLVHYGNEGAKTWRTANPGSGMVPGTVWASDRAWGYGASSGGLERFENVTFESRTDAWYVHDNADFDRPCVAELVGCRLVSRNADGVIALQSLGAGLNSRVTILGSEASFLRVQETDSPWISQAPAQQVADHSQIQLTMDGHSPIGFTSVMRGKALRIESASTGTTSTVRASGTAASALLGLATTRDGGGGLKGYLYGQWDISGILVGLSSNVAVDNTLGKRLGDCSTTPKTLTVTVDGGAPVNVVFNANHTAQSNATVLGIINSALGSAAVASEYLVSQGETYPVFTDREATLTNVGATGIKRWAAVKFSGSRRTIALMEPGDAIADFAGVALEPVPPGKTGRILRSGLLSTTDQMAGLSTAVAYGAAIYLSANTAGEFATAGTKQLATVHHAGYARF